MHGRRQRCGEGCGDRRPFVRHMWPATRVEAAPPPAKGPASPPPPPRSSLPPLRTTSYPPAPTTPPAAPHKQEAADSPRPPSADSFLKVPHTLVDISLWDLLSSARFRPNSVCCSSHHQMAIISASKT
uniref:Uncharacterized protein n=1 Tax=Aegilops tauschii subsp. strangulata TaxID=200361 RepID=A0A453PKP1_AEGTS